MAPAARSVRASQPAALASLSRYFKIPLKPYNQCQKTTVEEPGRPEEDLRPTGSPSIWNVLASRSTSSPPPHPLPRPHLTVAAPSTAKQLAVQQARPRTQQVPTPAFRPTPPIPFTRKPTSPSPPSPQCPSCAHRRFCPLSQPWTSPCARCLPHPANALRAQAPRTSPSPPLSSAAIPVMPFSRAAMLSPAPSTTGFPAQPPGPSSLRSFSCTPHTLWYHLRVLSAPSTPLLSAGPGATWSEDGDTQRGGTPKAVHFPAPDKGLEVLDRLFYLHLHLLSTSSATFTASAADPFRREH
ncbi:hypothetical protein DFH07DRAFT_954429 [Mycena maculata]|uniref:Uncharacterized protein n=1 Tax=Mycena maculata TaxID=230809 RepID=A0AAD7JQC7_9AGAR|nr:hypothetical protein DFH07DRAFT_954429 [Mycena maculata]